MPSVVNVFSQQYSPLRGLSKNKKKESVEVKAVSKERKLVGKYNGNFNKEMLSIFKKQRSPPTVSRNFDMSLM